MGIKKIHSALASALTLTAFTATGLFAATAYQNQVGYLTKGQKQMAVVGAERTFPSRMPTVKKSSR